MPSPRRSHDATTSFGALAGRLAGFSELCLQPTKLVLKPRQRRCDTFLGSGNLNFRGGLVGYYRVQWEDLSPRLEDPVVSVSVSLVWTF
jgi:hypothetical protein